MTFETLKAIHILGVVLFLGNIIITGVWKAFADATRQPQTIAFAQRLVTLTDWIFTAGGVALVLVGGYGMAYVNGLDLRGEYWLIWGQGLFIASGLIWATILIPIQIKQASLARGLKDAAPIPQTYWRLNRHWYFWGILATLLPMANIYFMVFKP